MVFLRDYCFYVDGKEFSVDVRRVDSFIGKGRGLTFRTRNTKNLLFEFKREKGLAITSYFVFFDFLAVWLDSKNNVIDLKIVRPFELSILPDKPFTKLIEIPVNKSTEELVKKLVDKRKV